MNTLSSERIKNEIFFRESDRCSPFDQLTSQDYSPSSVVYVPERISAI